MDWQQYATLQRKAASLDAWMEDTFKEEKFYDIQTFLFCNFCAFIDIFYMFLFLQINSVYASRLSHNKE
jgi:hypothetical protein